eukprot:g2518.t1
MDKVSLTAIRAIATSLFPASIPNERDKEKDAKVSESSQIGANPAFGNRFSTTSQVQKVVGKPASASQCRRDLILHLDQYLTSARTRIEGLSIDDRLLFTLLFLLQYGGENTDSSGDDIELESKASPTLGVDNGCNDDHIDRHATLCTLLARFYTTNAMGNNHQMKSHSLSHPLTLVILAGFQFQFLFTASLLLEQTEDVFTAQSCTKGILASPLFQSSDPTKQLAAFSRMHEACMQLANKKCAPVICFAYAAFITLLEKVSKQLAKHDPENAKHLASLLQPAQPIQRTVQQLITFPRIPLLLLSIEEILINNNNKGEEQDTKFGKTTRPLLSTMIVSSTQKVRSMFLLETYLDVEPKVHIVLKELLCALGSAFPTFRRPLHVPPTLISDYRYLLMTGRKITDGASTDGNHSFTNPRMNYHSNCLNPPYYPGTQPSLVGGRSSRNVYEENEFSPLIRMAALLRRIFTDQPELANHFWNGLRLEKLSNDDSVNSASVPHNNIIGDGNGSIMIDPIFELLEQCRAWFNITPYPLLSVMSALCSTQESAWRVLQYLGGSPTFRLDTHAVWIQLNTGRHVQGMNIDTNKMNNSTTGNSILSTMNNSTTGNGILSTPGITVDQNSNNNNNPDNGNRMTWLQTEKHFQYFQYLNEKETLSQFEITMPEPQEDDSRVDDQEEENNPLKQASSKFQNEFRFVQVISKYGVRGDGLRTFASPTNEMSDGRNLINGVVATPDSRGGVSYDATARTSSNWRDVHNTINASNGQQFSTRTPSSASFTNNDNTFSGGYQKPIEPFSPCGTPGVLQRFPSSAGNGDSIVCFLQPTGGYSAWKVIWNWLRRGINDVGELKIFASLELLNALFQSATRKTTKNDDEENDDYNHDLPDLYLDNPNAVSVTDGPSPVYSIGKYLFQHIASEDHDSLKKRSGTSSQKKGVSSLNTAGNNAIGKTTVGTNPIVEDNGEWEKYVSELAESCLGSLDYQLNYRSNGTANTGGDNINNQFSNSNSTQQAKISKMFDSTNPISESLQNTFPGLHILNALAQEPRFVQRIGATLMKTWGDNERQMSRRFATRRDITVGGRRLSGLSYRSNGFNGDTDHLDGLENNIRSGTSSCCLDWLIHLAEKHTHTCGALICDLMYSVLFALYRNRAERAGHYQQQQQMAYQNNNQVGNEGPTVTGMNFYEAVGKTMSTATSIYKIGSREALFEAKAFRLVQTLLGPQGNGRTQSALRLCAQLVNAGSLAASPTVYPNIQHYLLLHPNLFDILFASHSSPYSSSSSSSSFPSGEQKVSIVNELNNSILLMMVQSEGLLQMERGHPCRVNFVSFVKRHFMQLLHFGLEGTSSEPIASLMDTVIPRCLALLASESYGFTTAATTTTVTESLIEENGQRSVLATSSSSQLAIIRMFYGALLAENSPFMKSWNTKIKVFLKKVEKEKVRILQNEKTEGGQDIDKGGKEKEGDSSPEEEMQSIADVETKHFLAYFDVFMASMHFIFDKPETPRTTEQEISQSQEKSRSSPNSFSSELFSVDDLKDLERSGQSLANVFIEMLKLYDHLFWYNPQVLSKIFTVLRFLWEHHRKYHNESWKIKAFMERKDTGISSSTTTQDPENLNSMKGELKGFSSSFSFPASALFLSSLLQTLRTSTTFWDAIAFSLFYDVAESPILGLENLLASVATDENQNVTDLLPEVSPEINVVIRDHCHRLGARSSALRILSVEFGLLQTRTRRRQKKKVNQEKKTASGDDDFESKKEESVAKQALTALSKQLRLKSRLLSWVKNFLEPLESSLRIEEQLVDIGNGRIHPKRNGFDESVTTNNTTNENGSSNVENKIVFLDFPLSSPSALHSCFQPFSRNNAMKRGAQRVQVVLPYQGYGSKYVLDGKSFDTTNIISASSMKFSMNDISWLNLIWSICDAQWDLLQSFFIFLETHCYYESSEEQNQSSSTINREQTATGGETTTLKTQHLTPYGTRGTPSLTLSVTPGTDGKAPSAFRGDLTSFRMVKALASAQAISGSSTTIGAGMNGNTSLNGISGNGVNASKKALIIPRQGLRKVVRAIVSRSLLGFLYHQVFKIILRAKDPSFSKVIRRCNLLSTGSSAGGCGPTIGNVGGGPLSSPTMRRLSNNDVDKKSSTPSSLPRLDTSQCAEILNLLNTRMLEYSMVEDWMLFGKIRDETSWTSLSCLLLLYQINSLNEGKVTRDFTTTASSTANPITDSTTTDSLDNGRHSEDNQMNSRNADASKTNVIVHIPISDVDNKKNGKFRGTLQGTALQGTTTSADENTNTKSQSRLNQTPVGKVDDTNQSELLPSSLNNQRDGSTKTSAGQGFVAGQNISQSNRSSTTVASGTSVSSSVPFSGTVSFHNKRLGVALSPIRDFCIPNGPGSTSTLQSTLQSTQSPHMTPSNTNVSLTPRNLSEQRIGLSGSLANTSNVQGGLRKGLSFDGLLKPPLPTSSSSSFSSSPLPSSSASSYGSSLSASGTSARSQQLPVVSLSGGGSTKHGGPFEECMLSLLSCTLSYILEQTKLEMATIQNNIYAFYVSESVDLQGLISLIEFCLWSMERDGLHKMETDGKISRSGQEEGKVGEVLDKALFLFLLTLQVIIQRKPHYETMGGSIQQQNCKFSFI